MDAHARLDRQGTPPLRALGRMTAAMRAIRPPGAPRLLRVAIVSGGRIVEERVVEPRTRITVGAGGDCTFVLPEKQGPPLVLFEPAGSGWELRVVPGVGGRVATDSGGVVDIAAGPSRVKLAGDARGRVVLGHTVFLFQLVARPPAGPRPQLPLALKARLASQIDWPLTALVALSFLLHFGFVGGMYSDWMDPTVDTELGARFVVPPSTLPPPPVETQSDAAVSASASAAAGTTAPSTPRAPGHAQRPAPRADAPNDVDSLVHEWSALRVAAIGVTAPGANLRRALQQGDEVAPVNLDALGERRTGVDDRPSALDLPHAGEPMAPGRRGDLRDLEHTTAAVASTAGPARPVVPFSLRQDPPQATSTIANVESVIRTQLQPRARACYQHAVNADESLPDGSLVVVIRVAPSGEVTSAGIANRVGLSAPVGSCIAGAAQRLVFDAPGPPGATVSVPMHFVKQ
jgi:hypothetical protein